MQSFLTCYGGTGTVTGANFLFDTSSPSTLLGAGKKILIDCGALEAGPESHTINALPFKYDPASIDVLIITHAHADHIGRVPKLVRDGFRGVIYSTAATRDLAALMFDDAVNVMRMEVQKRGGTVLYEKEDAEHAMSLWQTHEYHETFSIGDAHIEFLDAGHILGSAMVKCTRGTRTIIFTGDLGNSPEPLLNDTESAEGANYILMESVYGDRVHEDRDDRANLLRGVIESTRKKGGTLLIPSFSIERTQILLYEIDQMIERGEIESMPVYLDAPLAIRVTEVFKTHHNLLNPQAQSHFGQGHDPFTFKSLHVIKDIAQSRQIHEAPSPKIIIAGAGMSVGGRIRSHEVQYLPDPKATILFVGYQAASSLGRRIQDGNKEITIDGEHLTVRATIASLSGYSGHKDRDGLLAFVESAGQSLEKVFVAMGEPKSELFLSQRIRDFLGIDAIAPEVGKKMTLEW